MSLLQRYSLKLTFALTLLIGLQLPYFLAQYEARVDAHYIESKAQLNHYQKLADLLFSGDLKLLVEKHKNSEIALFKAEAELIEKLMSRTAFLKTQKIALQGSSFQRFTFLITQINQPLYIETKNNYQANIMISKQAIIIGLTIATLMTFLLEMLFMLATLLVKKMLVHRRQKAIN